MWTVPNWDVPAGNTYQSGSTTSLLLMNYDAGGALNLDPRDISDDYIVDRVVGTLWYINTGNPAGGGISRSQFHWGIAVGDIDPTTGNLLDASLFDPSNGADSYRRWLYLHHSYPYQVNSAGGTPLFGNENTNATIGPFYGTVDIQPRVRLKPAQRLFAFFHPVQSNGRTDTIWTAVNDLRCLIHEGRR